MSEQHEFNPIKIFITLLILTAAEVAWGTFLPYEWKFALWSGLLIMAFWKGALIFMYFMHMKYEGWIVKGLIVPTPILIVVILAATYPDVANNDSLNHGVAHQLDPETGEIVELGQGSRNIVLHPLDGDGEDDAGGGH